MKRPSFQFYPADWSSNPNLKRCSFAEKGIWIEVMCLMHDQEEYGVLRWTLKEIAEAVKCKPIELLALHRKGVLKGDDKSIVDPFVYTPRSGRKDGPPVTLVPTQDGPVWYSSRMVRDEYVRTIRAELSGQGDTSKAASNATPKHSPKPPLGDESGEAFGVDFDAHPSRAQAPRAAPSSSSSSSTTCKEISKLSLASPPKPEEEQSPERHIPAKPSIPECPHLEILSLWEEVLPALPKHLPQQWKGTRQAHLRARWREKAAEKGWRTCDEGLAYFRRVFELISESAFLTGRTASSDPSRRPFQATLEWVVCPLNWAKVLEQRYNDKVAA